MIICSFINGTVLSKSTKDDHCPTWILCIFDRWCIMYCFQLIHCHVHCVQSLKILICSLLLCQFCYHCFYLLISYLLISLEGVDQQLVYFLPSISISLNLIWKKTCTIYCLYCRKYLIQNLWITQNTCVLYLEILSVVKKISFRLVLAYSFKVYITIKLYIALIKSTKHLPSFTMNCTDGVIVSVLALSVVDHGFKPRWGQTKDCKIGICCFSTKHAALRRKSKHWLARNQNNVSEWSDMSISRLLLQCVRVELHVYQKLLFQWASTIKSN